MNEPGLNDIQVDVETRYIEEQSNPEQNYYVFAYTITIRNKGRQAAQLPADGVARIAAEELAKTANKRRSDDT